MTPRTFETRCLRLPAVTKVVQWEGTSVFKVGGKMFALGGGFAARSGGYMFKTSNMAYAMLIEHGLARPAPYLARAKWVQLVSNNALPDAELSTYLVQAHALIAAKLTRNIRKELGLDSPDAHRHDDHRVQHMDRSRRH
ncbi:MmcQ/YjbR family DNA-binding protein [Bradyrhizobium diazoefficiens]|jgi:predicted DNA-binding protein (MmcQ/YjbR family)|nr:MmcQ/YjbR family DNA-binding protein [Bradyrhizobium diazoefficiens]MBR0701343.1 MmcQ/YjbR family DNA-binding protein [Bradyrhizobium diazoefficiens]MBR0769768.1 MmcQ/YjbR family DNA-binding protein [Bradyrhizobium diazoefficiens]